MRLLLYELLTQGITALGWLRSRMITRGTPKSPAWELRRDRTFYATTYESWDCCDCGATHATRPMPGEKPRFPAFRMIPMRPIGYHYKMRAGAGQSSDFVDETKRPATLEEARRSLGMPADGGGLT